MGRAVDIPAAPVSLSAPTAAADICGSSGAICPVGEQGRREQGLLRLHRPRGLAAITKRSGADNLRGSENLEVSRLECF